jgi:ankyrin repeat protein
LRLKKRTVISTVLQNERLLEWFLDHDASSNAPNDTGRTALDVAAWLASPQVVAQLLQHGGNIKKTNALHMAVRSPKSGRYQMVEYLLDAGADIDMIEYAGTELLSSRASSGFGTALHYAAQEGREDLMHLLLEKGASIKIRDTLGCTAAEVAEKAGHLELVQALSVDQRNKL